MASRPSHIDEVSETILSIKTYALAFVCALLGGVGLFVATAWLVIRDGVQAGPHLQLLSHYFIGYSVTWWGSIVGMFYGALIGGVIGWAVGIIYNKTVNLRQR